MGYRPIVNCRHCRDPLDVFVAWEERFCSEDCKDAEGERACSDLASTKKSSGERAEKT